MSQVVCMLHSNALYKGINHNCVYICISPLLSIESMQPHVYLPINPIYNCRKDPKDRMFTSPLASFILFIQCHQCNVASYDTSTHSPTTLRGWGDDVSSGIVANARDWAGLLLERQLIKLGSQPSGVWQISIYHQRTGARVKLETLLLLTPRC